MDALPRLIIQPLQNVKNLSLRALQFIDRYYPINELHKECIVKVSDKIEYKIQTFIRSMLYSLYHIPEPLHSLVRPKCTFHKYQTRTNYHLYVEREKRSSGKYQLKYQPSDNWNKLPQEIRQQPTHSQFKTALYEWKLP